MRVWIRDNPEFLSQSAGEMMVFLCGREARRRERGEKRDLNARAKGVGQE